MKGGTSEWNKSLKSFPDLDEVHEDVSEALHVVPPALLDAEVGVDGGVAGRAGQVFVFSEQGASQN